MCIENKLYFVLLIIFINNTTLLSQSIKIIDIDNGNYPRIGITFEFNSDSSLDFDELKIVENDKNCHFTIDNCTENRQKKLMCFAIDEPLFKNDSSKQVILNLIKSLLDGKGTIVLINVVIAQYNEEKDVVFTPLSIEFTDNYVHFLAKYQSSEIAKMSFQNSTEQLFSNIRKYHSLDYNVVYISRDTDTCKICKQLRKYSDSLLINCTNVKYPENTYDEQSAFDELKKQVQSSGSLNSYVNIGKPFNYYKVYYRSNQAKKVNFFEMHYKNDVERGFFKDKSIADVVNDTMIYKYASLCLLIVSVILLYMFIKKGSVDSKKNITENNSVKPIITVEINDTIEKFELNKLRTTIGRGKGNDILIANLTISNNHAAITNEGGVFYIEDTDSTNGVKVNEIKVNKHQLQHGDVMRLGKATLKLNY